jgi:hypothetical protein
MPADAVDHTDLLFIDAVGSSADRQPNDFRVVDSFGVEAS